MKREGNGGNRTAIEEEIDWRGKNEKKGRIEKREKGGEQG